MGWMQKAYETYENNIHMAGKEVDGCSPLSPVGHQINDAKIEIEITEYGEFSSARTIPKTDSKTMIPTTEESASRAGSKISPHPLCDKLIYVAKGFGKYVCIESAEKIENEKKRAQVAKNIKSIIEKGDDSHNAYMEQLKKWTESPYTHFKIKAIYEYCLNGNLIEDLMQAGVLQKDEELSRVKGSPILKCDETIEGSIYQNCLIRWRVLSVKNEELPVGTWEDGTLFDSYTNYMSENMKGEKTDLCYVSGKRMNAAAAHPKGVSKFDSNAKLISANDKSGFTYRGRFETPKDVEVVGYEVSQKAHSALKWLVSNQGLIIGGRTFLCWNPKGKKTPEIPTKGFWGDDEENEKSNTMPEYKKKLRQNIYGFNENERKERLDDHDDILVMAFSAPIPGRLSVTYYNELKASDFLQRIEKWRATCCWYYTKFKPDKTPQLDIDSPGLKIIVDCAYGIQQGNYIVADDRILQENVQRILQCIVDDAPVPREIVHALAIRASMPLAYSFGNHERVLSTACAFIHKYRIQNKEECNMTLDQDNHDRSYLFGRLLAVAEKVERKTYGENDKGREPNAVRLWMNFQQHPLHTWRILEEALIPYYSKLNGSNQGTKIYYKKLTEEIVSKLPESKGEKLNASLDDIYLIGYYLQRKELNNYKQTNDKTEEN